MFFDGDDSLNRAMPLGIFTSSGNALYQDNAMAMRSVELLIPARDSDLKPSYENPLTLRYQRAYLASCSLRTDEERCWNIIRSATGLTESQPPDCKKTYAEMESRTTSKQRKSVSADPSIIVYEVETVLDNKGVIRIAPVSKAVACYPSE